jgi:hypothetical protein
MSDRFDKAREAATICSFAALIMSDSWSAFTLEIAEGIYRSAEMR